MTPEPSAANLHKLGREQPQSDLDNRDNPIGSLSCAHTEELAAKALEAVNLAWHWLRWFDGHDEAPEQPLTEVETLLRELRETLTSVSTKEKP